MFNRRKAGDVKYCYKKISTTAPSDDADASQKITAEASEKKELDLGWFYYKF